jgi:hypothetical protein
VTFRPFSSPFSHGFEAGRPNEISKLGKIKKRFITLRGILSMYVLGWLGD